MSSKLPLPVPLTDFKVLSSQQAPTIAILEMHHPDGLMRYGLSKEYVHALVKQLQEVEALLISKSERH